MMGERTKGPVSVDEGHPPLLSTATGQTLCPRLFSTRQRANAARLAAGWNLLETLEETNAADLLAEHVQYEREMGRPHRADLLFVIAAVIRTALSPSTPDRREV
jgi:hypothetical protein